MAKTVIQYRGLILTYEQSIKGETKQEKIALRMSSKSIEFGQEASPECKTAVLLAMAYGREYLSQVYTVRIVRTDGFIDVYAKTAEGTERKVVSGIPVALAPIKKGKAK
jgi:hypothetical protein